MGERHQREEEREGGIERVATKREIHRVKRGRCRGGRRGILERGKRSKRKKNCKEWF